MTWRNYFLYLIKQDYLLKSVLRALLLTNQVSLYLLFLLELICSCIVFLWLSSYLRRSQPTFLKLTDTDWIPVVLTNCESELSNIVADLFNICLKESCLPNCWKISSVVPIFENVWRVIKIFEQLVNNGFLNCLKKCGFFSDSQYGFRSSWSSWSTILSGRITKAFNRSGATHPVELYISKAFDRVWHTGLLHKLKSYRHSLQVFQLNYCFLSNRQLQLVLDRKYLKFLRAPFFQFSYSYFAAHIF